MDFGQGLFRALRFLKNSTSIVTIVHNKYGHSENKSSKPPHHRKALAVLGIIVA